MQIFFFRHGKAEKAAPGQPDEERPLSEEGVRQLRRLAVVLAWMEIGIERILCSPLLRARQTAELLAEALQVPVEPVEALRPGCTLEAIQELATTYREHYRLLLVGHQPDFGQIVQQLTGGRIEMKPASMAAVESGSWRPERGLLIGLYDPELMEKLART